MSKAQRDKGARGEREFCKLLEEEFGTKAYRNLGQARDAGNDIHHKAFHFEVKRRKSLKTLASWMKQAASSDSRLHGVAMRADGGEWMMLVPWFVFAYLARAEFCEHPGELREDLLDDNYGGTS